MVGFGHCYLVENDMLQTDPNWKRRNHRQTVRLPEEIKRPDKIFSKLNIYADRQLSFYPAIFRKCIRTIYLSS